MIVTDNDTATRRKPGPAPRLVDTRRLPVMLPAATRARLKAYADKRGITLSEAVRQAIDLLPQD